MRFCFPRSLAAVALLLGPLVLPRALRADATSSPDGVQRPLGGANLALRDPVSLAKRQIRFAGTWKAAQLQITNPKAVDSVLRIKGSGVGDGDSGPIILDAAKWKAKGKSGFRYTDKRGTAGGIRSIRVTFTATGGTLQIVGGSSKWAYAVTQQQSQISVLLSMGSARWCAMFDGPFKKNGLRRVDAVTNATPAACPCADDTNSTWAAIQKHIFEKHGCTAASCHGAGGNTETHLDLTAATAHQNLVGRASDADPTKQRVKIFAARDSMLFLKLAKATLVEGYGNVAKSPMPLGTPPLSKDELEVVRLWIQAGAPALGVVGGTGNLLQSCLPPPDPIKAEPVPPPAISDGVQFYAPPWDIPARDPAGTNGEGEVCYTTWFDFSAQVPPEFRTPCPDYWGGPTRQCFFFNHPQLTQDPNSHHSIIHIYRGQYRDDPANADAKFGPFTCLGGANAGQTCDPKGAASQCPGGGCAGVVRRTIACLFFFGPPDLTGDFKVNGTKIGDNLPTVGGSQQPFLDEPYPPGVFGALPIQGTMVWNSHAFNVSTRPTTNEQYFNIYFAPPADRQFPARAIFEDDKIFLQNVPPYEKTEYCNTHTVPQGARVFQLSSHNHKRGVLWRTWEPPNAPCAVGRDTDPDLNCHPDASREPTVVSTTYNDPTLFRYDTPKAFDDPDPATRTFKFCSFYDNGGGDPSNVKRQSASIPSIVGGKCDAKVLQCIANDGNDPRKGKLCAAADGKSGDDRACDSAPGANDGQCDACPLRGGVTTEDEMFILTGLGYCAPGTPCEASGF